MSQSDLFPVANCNSGLSIDDEFEKFWHAYPRRTGKLDARRAYAKAVKLAAPDRIIAGAYRYAQERYDQDEQFTKHPATWLNKGCWDDEPASRGRASFTDLAEDLLGSGHGRQVH